MNKLIPFLLLLLVVISCRKSPEAKLNISGHTMGTDYHISYFGALDPAFAKKSVDSLMLALNAEVSTYIPTSTISIFNTSRADTVIVSQNNFYFWAVFAEAKKIYQLTDGYFDPTVMPLVNYWGFGYTGHKAVKDVDSLVVDSLRQLVGFDKLAFREDSLFRLHPNVQLDFSALAKGYGVDLVAEWFDSQGVKSYFVEIGGENRALGRKPNGQWWTVGISIPKEAASINAYNTIIKLKNQSMATSGNYRNYREVKGQKYSHTINPQTGYSERSALLSGSVLADKCMRADALATAMMTMGYKKSKKLQQSLDSVEIILKIGLPDGSIKTEFSSPSRAREFN